MLLHPYSLETLTSDHQANLRAGASRDALALGLVRRQRPMHLSHVASLCASSVRRFWRQ